MSYKLLVTQIFREPTHEVALTTTALDFDTASEASTAFNILVMTTLRSGVTTHVLKLYGPAL